MEWSHLDLPAAEWRQPDRLTKNQDPHRFRLHDLALGILRERRQALADIQVGVDAVKAARNASTNGRVAGLVFPAPRSGQPIDTFSDLKAALTAATSPKEGEDGTPLTGWTWHDFRRSFATALGEAGIPEFVADAVLNHRQSATRGGVLGVYQRASRWPEQARAMEFWGRLLAAAIEGREAGAEVLHLQARTG